MTTENEDVETNDEATGTDAADEASPGDSPAEDGTSPPASASEGETDAAGEESAEETPEQKAEREKEARKAARLKAAEDAEKKAASAREKRRKEREDQERIENIAAREQQAHALLARAQAMIDDLEKRAEAVRRGGVEGIKALGIDYADWTKQELEAQSPDAVAQRALRRIDELENQLKQRDQKDADARAAAQAEEGAKRFEAFVDDNATDYPDAAMLPSRLVRSFADEVAAEYQRETGRLPSFGALLPRLDEKAKKFHDEQKQRQAKRAPAATTPRENGTHTPQANSNGQPASSPANRTLTPAVAATKAKAPRPPTPEEEDEWALNELRQAMAADSKAARAL